MINIENNGIGKFSLKSEHITLRAIKLNASTDNHDTVVTEQKKYMFRSAIEETEGHIFILSDSTNDTSTVFIIPTPDCVTPSLEIADKTVIIKTHGYPISLGCAKNNEAERMCRDWYRLQYHPDTLHTMSNTWGDRNGRTRVNDEFIRREIDSGAELGLDVIQIDDGWQRGVPENFDKDGLRDFDGSFWKLKEEIFPRGMESLSKYAANNGVELGLWFAPHSKGVFEHFDRDISVLSQAYNEWNIRYFKLDMLQLITMEHCEKMLDFLDTVFSLGDGISVELDVTADKRLGYLMCAPYGTIFVENRYTAWANYYPHRTLRNLWLLSRFIPASKFQFELVNPELSIDKYSKDDPLRPELYDIDYLFASVMVSNPLFWMETQFLSENAKLKLTKIIKIWKKYRAELADADVYPVGEEPSGASITGFVADCGNIKHIILLREYTKRDRFCLDIGDKASNAELLLSNSDAEYSLNGGKLSLEFGKMRSYIWLRVN